MIDDELFEHADKYPLSIAEILSSTSELSTLNSLLEGTDLKTDLKEETTFTFFAPSNEALNDVDLSGVSEDSIQNLLLNHVWRTNTADFSQTLQTGYKNTLATGVNGNNLSFFVNTSEQISFNGISSPVLGMIDKGATNGVLHVVDNLIDLPNVFDLISVNPNYSSLTAALTQSELTNVFQSEGPFTIFAPDNDAFSVFLNQFLDGHHLMRSPKKF